MSDSSPSDRDNLPTDAPASDDVVQDAPNIEQQVQGDRAQTIGQISGGAAIASVEGQSIHIDNRTYQADPETVKRLVREELRVAHTEYGQPVGQGLTALAELMQVPAVKDAVITFRVVFQSACEQIDVIANYKALHDLLHTLELQCYGVIVQTAKLFPDDDMAIDNLMQYELTLQDLLAEMQQVAARETVATRELRWLSELQQAQAHLQSAIADLEGAPLKRAIYLLNRVLANHPDRINTQLNEAARALRLPDLVEALQFIASNLAQAQLDAQKLQQFEQGVEVLASLEERLGALVIGHDYWQSFDREMRRIESTLGRDFIELEMSWPYLQDQADGLMDAEADDWTVEFQKNSHNLDAALKEQHPVKIRRFFKVYRQQARNRFFQVDVTLKRLCEELREVGGPLALVLRMME
ncbi:MAG: toll/interleukin-1 receptor domain-containing protein [Cyanobacteria bacterium P01_F01_bin.3]